MSRLSALDYVVFSLFLVASGGIGIYHGVKGRRQQTTADFLMAGRSMSKFPIAMSLLVSFLSAISILGIPSEVYTFGLSYILIGVAFVGILLMSAFLYVPVFYGLKITSTNEYLEMRFSPGIRLTGCILFVVTYTLYLSIALYAPALALEAVSGLPMLITIIVNGLVCVFYTTVGGLKAVIWTDVFQALVMGVGLVSVMVTGTIEVGGISNVWEINNRMNRTRIFDFDPDPTVRTTFWTLIIGGIFTYLFSWSVSQLSVQRFLASKSLKEAQRALLMNIPVMIFVSVICCLDGLIIFAVYAECDLVKDGKISGNDQIVPYFVVDKLNYMKGIPGLFIATLFSGCLSTVSSGINSLSTILLEDILRKIKKDIPDVKATQFSKFIGVAYGTVIILGAIVLKYIKVALLIQLTASLFNMCAGPLLGIFTLGMITRRANWKGAYIGQVVGLGFTLWIYCGSLMYPPKSAAAPISVSGCGAFNVSKKDVTKTQDVREYSEPLAKLYGLSFLYYGFIGTVVTVIIGIISSYILETSEDRNKSVDKKLLFQVRWSRLANPTQCQETPPSNGSPILKGYRKNGTKENIPMPCIENKGFEDS